MGAILFRCEERRKWLGRSVCWALVMGCTWVAAQTPPAAEWLKLTREQAKMGKLDAALTTVDQRLSAFPDDLDAQGCRGRVLAWKGRWPEAENEYRLVLQRAPQDVDILAALSDVLLWQGKLDAALEIIDRARPLAPSDQEVLLRRARILRALGRRREQREQLHEVLRVDHDNSEARATLGALKAEYKHDLHLGNEVDTFNFIDPAQMQSLILTSRWTSNWSTAFSSHIYQRFGTQAQGFSASTILRFRPSDWLGVGGGGANHNAIVPKAEASVEYGHGFHFQNRWIRGLEAAYQQRWLWYAGAHVLTLTGSQTYYLPRDWFWTLSLTGARSGFTSTGIEWAPSGNARLHFPLRPPRLSGMLSFGLGAESYSQRDQIGRVSARTFAGGLDFRLAANQAISSYIARQDRSQSRSQTTYGVAYDLRF